MKLSWGLIRRWIKHHHLTGYSHSAKHITSRYRLFDYIFFRKSKVDRPQSLFEEKRVIWFSQKQKIYHFKIVLGFLIGCCIRKWTVYRYRPMLSPIVLKICLNPSVSSSQRLPLIRIRFPIRKNLSIDFWDDPFLTHDSFQVPLLNGIRFFEYTNISTSNFLASPPDTNVESPNTVSSCFFPSKISQEYHVSGGSDRARKCHTFIFRKLITSFLRDGRSSREK